MLEGVIRTIATKALQGNACQMKTFLELAAEAEREPHMSIVDLVGKNIKERDVNIIIEHPKIKKAIEKIYDERFQWIMEIMTDEQRQELRKKLVTAIADGDDRDRMASR